MHAYTQNGEEDTVLRDDLKRVKKKLSLTFAIAIIGTCVVFGLLYYLGIDLLNNYIEGTSHLIYDNEKPYIDEFQQYVSDNNISTQMSSNMMNGCRIMIFRFIVLRKRGR